MRAKLIFSLFIVLILLNATACEKATPQNPSTTSQAPTNAVSNNSKEFASAKAGNLNVILSNAQGHLKEGENEFTVEFRDTDGKSVDVGASTIFIDMPAMGAMPAMKSNVKLMTTNTPGIYQATTNLEMAGTWNVHVAYKGGAGEGKADFSITAK